MIYVCDIMITFMYCCKLLLLLFYFWTLNTVHCTRPTSSYPSFVLLIKTFNIFGPISTIIVTDYMNWFFCCMFIVMIRAPGAHSFFRCCLHIAYLLKCSTNYTHIDKNSGKSSHEPKAKRAMGATIAGCNDNRR